MFIQVSILVRRNGSDDEFYTAGRAVNGGGAGGMGAGEKEKWNVFLGLTLETYPRSI